MNLFRKNKKSLGLLGPSPRQPEDYQLRELQTEPIELAKEFHTYECDPKYIEDQNGKGICYSMASTGSQEYENSKEYNQEFDLSERYVVHFTKKISQIWGSQGDFLKNVCKAIKKYGIAPEKNWPTDYSLSWDEFARPEPPTHIQEKAKKFAGKRYWEVQTDLDSIRQAMQKNDTTVFLGMPWYEEYYKPDSDGRLPIADGNKKGGHAIMATDWENGKLWHANSWTSDWGYNGYFYIPFEDFEKYPIWRAWVLIDKEHPKPEQKEGFVADAFLKKVDYEKGDVVTPRQYNLHLRTSPWGPIIDLITPGRKLRILGTEKKTSRINWEKVKIIED